MKEVSFSSLLSRFPKFSIVDSLDLLISGGLWESLLRRQGSSCGTRLNTETKLPNGQEYLGDLSLKREIRVLI